MTFYQIIILAFACILTISFIREKDTSTGTWHTFLSLVFWIWFYNIYPTVEKKKEPQPKIEIKENPFILYPKKDTFKFI